MEVVGGDEPLQPLVVEAAVLELHRTPPVGAGTGLHRGAGVGASFFGLDGQGAAQGVEAEQGVGARHHVHRGDRRAGNQVPAHHVAKRLVDANPVKVHRQALGRAQQRRGRVAPVVHIRLEGVVLGFVDMHTVQAPIHEGRNIQRHAVVDVPGGEGLDRCRDVADRLFEPRQGRLADHRHGGGHRLHGIGGLHARGKGGSQRQGQRAHAELGEGRGGLMALHEG